MKGKLKQILMFLCIIMGPVPAALGNLQPDVTENYAWVNKIRDEHPRLFFNSSSFKEVKATALGAERELFDQLKNRVDALFDKEITYREPLVPDGTQNSDHMYGTRAAEAAFVYLVTGDKKYLGLSKKLLMSITEYYQLRNSHNLNVHWYAYSRINAMAAYDWIYNDLSAGERKGIGAPLLEAIAFMPSAQRGNVFRRNNGNFKTGFYGPPCLPWYAGIVFHHSGINDSLSLALLRKGYDDHTSLLEYRSNTTGENGGASSAAVNYALGAYPWAEYNFFHTFLSATGYDISRQWTYVPKFLNYVFWNWLPEDQEYGYGDTRHLDNKLSLGLMHLHIAQMTHFYGETNPDLISLGKWMQTRLKKEKQDSFPFMRFLLTRSFEEIPAKGPDAQQSKAMFFKNMGQVFMRSGSGPEDTYAMFSAGGVLTQHRHYDNNNFIIYRKGYLALDSGTRPQPGLHLSHYYCRTVAHNCITIHMPGEKMPNYWGGAALSEEDLPVPNDGGQNNLSGSEVMAFEENDHYVYIASDATQSYNKQKAELVVRQFVFLPPDHFVVMDRVVSTQPEFGKKWLLHTAAEPAVRENEFLADHREGRIICRTIFPEKARLEKVGGPGRQFWSDGRNWPLPVLTPDDWNYQGMQWLNNDHDLFGQWRMEISPEKSNTGDIFLHLIQVGDTSMKTMSGSKPLKKEGNAGVSFEYKGKTFQVNFNTEGIAGGHITILQGGRKIVDQPFTGTVKL